MTYFNSFPQITYKFGNEETVNAIQNLSAYVDIIDQTKDNSSLYTKHTILDGDRPDVLSQKLYGNSSYYWTFYLMNDNIRRQGWPLSYNEVVNKAKEDYPNKTIVTRDLMFDKMDVGDTVTGQSSAATGTIVRRNLDLGQLVIKPTNTNSFQASELISDGTDTVTVASVAEEYNSAHHYEDANKNHADFDPTVGPGVLLTEVTYLDRYVEANNSLREINVIQPSVIIDVVTAFQEAL